MKKEMVQFERSFRKWLDNEAYEQAIECVFAIISNRSFNYIRYICEEYNWERYFRYRKWHFKKFGYFVYGKNYRQILFQFVRPCRWLTIRLFPVTQNQPIEFFHKYINYEKKEWLKVMRPRAEEVFQHQNIYKEIASYLSDEKSKYVYACILMAFVTMKYEYFELANCMSNTEYCPVDIFINTDWKCIVDCGGFDGDTASDFFTKHPEKIICRYYLIEPGAENIEKAKKRLSEKSNVVYIESAVGENGGWTCFEENGASGKIAEDREKPKVRLIKLDEAVPEKISFIKMDIEGSELAALKGACQHIYNDKPDMAICAYHKPEDIREIVKYVRSVNSEYDIFLRHYGDKFKELVLYFRSR